MKLTNTIKSIAIGSFDGIHQGHQALIKQVEAVVVIEQNRSTLTPGHRRTDYIKQPCFFYQFETLKQLSSKAFINKLKGDFPHLETIVVGYDFAFGHKKEGDTALLQQLFKGNVTIVDEVRHENISIHSRSIKEHIRNGEIRLANALLDHHYKIAGEVISGQGLGKKELVPTLNLKVQDYLLPKEGVYATKTLIKNYWYPSVSFLGHRVTTDGSFAVETHILNKNIGEVNGEINVKFIAFIRKNQKFEGLEMLKQQIQKDIKRAKTLL